jgi:hypothetical protein
MSFTKNISFSGLRESISMEDSREVFIEKMKVATFSASPYEQALGEKAATATALQKVAAEKQILDYDVSLGTYRVETVNKFASTTRYATSQIALSVAENDLQSKVMAAARADECAKIAKSRMRDACDIMNALEAQLDERPDEQVERAFLNAQHTARNLSQKAEDLRSAAKGAWFEVKLAHDDVFNAEHYLNDAIEAEQRYNEAVERPSLTLVELASLLTLPIRNSLWSFCRR